MRICFAQDRPVFPLFLGGAEISMHETLRLLAAAGHQCLAIGHVSDRTSEIAKWLHSKPGKVEMQQCELGGLQTGRTLPSAVEITLDVGYEVRLTALSNFWSFLEGALRDFRPDVVFSQLHGSERVIHAAQQLNADVYHTIRDLNNPHNFIPYHSDLISRDSFTAITTSHFMQEQTMARHGVTSAVLYPAVDYKRFDSVGDGDGKAVLVFNPVPSKGGEIVKQLVKQMPAVDFILVAGWDQIRPSDWPFSNVHIEARTHYVENLYARAHVVIIPSQAEEAFCRVGVEAQAAGVPVLASAHSGLCESLGNTSGFVQHYQSSAAWSSRLSNLLASPTQQDALRQEGILNCRRFDLDTHYRTLIRMLANA